ncbi:MAG TPA: hypothetical protein VGK74_13645 [Symbiobacteriaceae bacterium]|jgi:hypothetical protein
MGKVVPMLQRRLPALVEENWRRLVQQVAESRGDKPVNLDEYGERLWQEWIPVIDDDQYFAEIDQRHRALGLLERRADELAEDLRDKALAVLTAPLPPTLFERQVLDPVFQPETEEAIDRDDPTTLLPDDVPEVPSCLAHLLALPKPQSKAQTAQHPRRHRWPL